MMKKEWFFFPLGPIFKAVGGIPVDRGRKTSLVDQMADHFSKCQKFHLAITPEGTLHITLAVEEVSSFSPTA